MRKMKMNDALYEAVEQAVRLLDQGQVSDAHEVLKTALATPEEASCEEAVEVAQEAPVEG